MSWAKITEAEIIFALKVDGSMHLSETGGTTTQIAYRIARMRAWSAPDEMTWTRFTRAIYRVCVRLHKARKLVRPALHQGAGTVTLWRIRGGAA